MAQKLPVFILTFFVTKIVVFCDTELSGELSDEFISTSFEAVTDSPHLLMSNFANMTIMATLTQSPLSETQNGQLDVCFRHGRCEKLHNTTCLGATLPYSHTSLILSGFRSQQIAKEQLELWQALRNIPRCWAVVQPFLCAIFFPRCESDAVQLPSQEMCAVTRGPCRLVELERGWPEYLQCRSEYPPKCKNNLRELKYPILGVCAPPLVPTADEALWFEGVKGCGLPCVEPTLTSTEHSNVRWFISALGGFSLACVAFTVATYLIDWRNANKYPAVVVFYINGCFLVAITAFLVQCQPGVREELTCRKDGTLRVAEPSPEGSLSCVVVFVCIYYFVMAAGMWLVVLAYSWHISFKSLVSGMDSEMQRKAAYFHLFCWSPPLVLTIAVLASALVEADPVAGICFLSSDFAIRIGYLLLPFSLSLAAAIFFLARALAVLVSLKFSCGHIISEHANSCLVGKSIRLLVFLVLLFSLLVITVYCHAYSYQHAKVWEKSFRDYVMCTSNLTDPSVYVENGGQCSLASRPSVNIHKMHLLAMFGAGIVMSSWCWTSNALDAWKRFIRRVIGVSQDEQSHLTKHRVIAQAYSKRNGFNNAGRLSISLRSMHNDPLGLNIEMNSAASGDISSTWAMALPNLMNRRGALDMGNNNSRRVSVDSSGTNHSVRRRSLDSQLSLFMSDTERLAALYASQGGGGARWKRQALFSFRRRQQRRRPYDRRNSVVSDNCSFASLDFQTPLQGETLAGMMVKFMNLSSDSLAPAPMKHGKMTVPGEMGRTNRGYSVEAELGWDKRSIAKLDGITCQKCLSSETAPMTSVSIQTSPELPRRHDTTDKAVQVSTIEMEVCRDKPKKSYTLLSNMASQISNSNTGDDGSDECQPHVSASAILCQPRKGEARLNVLGLKNGRSSSCRVRKLYRASSDVIQMV